MFKKLLLFSTMAIIGGCETINQANQCDPDKNYIISNPQAIEEYKKLKSEGKIRSYFQNVKNPDECNTNKCVKFDPLIYDFVEIYFNDKYRNGIYKITYSENKDEKDCMPFDNLLPKKTQKYCYKATKNPENIVYSRYEWNFEKNNNVLNLRFNDLKNNINLFDFKYQTYSTGAIGGPGGSVCPQAYVNHPEFKFNPYGFL